jgi:hypothetical protein
MGVEGKFLELNLSIGILPVEEQIPSRGLPKNWIVK